MSLIYKLLLLCFLIVCATGCTHELAHPLLNNDMAYLAKPVASDSSQWGTYISGNLGITDGFNIEDNNSYWEFAAHQSYTFQSGSVALGAFGYRGRYTLNTDSLKNLPALHNFSESHAYYGGGLRGSINFTLPTERADIRFIGVDAVWSKEWGEFLALRGAIPPLPDVIVNTDDELFSVALTSEVCIKLRPESQLAVKLFLGHVHKGQLENTESAGENFLAANLFYSYKPLFVTGQINLLENNGIKIGMGYRFW